MGKLAIMTGCAGLAAGLVVGYGLNSGPTPEMTRSDAQRVERVAAPLAADNSEITELRTQLAAARDNEAVLRDQLRELRQKSAEAITALAIADEPEELAGDDERQAQLADARVAIENGDVPTATALLYGLLNSAGSDDEHEQAQQGLLELYKTSYRRQRARGDQTPAAMWSLFEVHKLEPSAELKSEMISLSQQAYMEAQQYQAQDDLLATADRLTSLMHLSKMVDYELTTASGEQLNSQNFQQSLKQVETQPEYIPALEARAVGNLYGGDERARANVFWDYAKLATLKGRESLGDETFREQFVQSASEHLEYLQATNRSDEVRSRMDYLRYVFPQIVQRPEIAAFN